MPTASAADAAALGSIVPGACTVTPDCGSLPAAYIEDARELQEYVAKGVRPSAS